MHLKKALRNSYPTISIGVPVYNGGKTLRKAINSLIDQTFTDIEIIISDNASTDNTETICKEICRLDKRVRYTRQQENIGPAKNFEFVFKQAIGRYFMWAAADDYRSIDFLDVNFQFLENNADYVASTSPNCFEDNREIVKFSIVGKKSERIDQFINNCWISHGIYYSLIRTEILKKYPYHGTHYLAADWLMDIFLTSEGNVYRTEKGLMTSGVDGISNRRNPWKPFRTSPMSWIFPFYKFSLYTITLTKETAFSWRLKLIVKLLQINWIAAKNQLIIELYEIYSKHLKSRLKK